MQAQINATSLNNMRRWIIVIIKILIAALLLYLLHSHGYLDLSTIAGIERNSTTVSLLLFMLVLVLAALALMSVRLQTLLVPHGINLGFARALGLTLIGALSGSVLPGVVAGDIVKAIYLFGDAPEKRSSPVSAVLLDRLVGLSSLLLLGGCSALVALLSGTEDSIRPVALFSAGFSAVILVLGTASLFLIAGPGQRVYLRIRGRLPRKLVTLLSSLFLYRHHPAVLMQAVLLSLLSHALIVVNFIIAALLLDVPLGIGEHMILDPLAMLLNTVPLAPGGLGITESGFAYLYQLSGFNDGAAVALTGRFTQYLVFITGGLLALFSLRQRVQHPAT